MLFKNKVLYLFVLVLMLFGSSIFTNAMQISTENSNMVITDTTFISKWDTTRVSADSSAINQIVLPLESTGIYNFVVDWGDGSISNITSYNQAEVTHTYTVEGIYNITLDGTIFGFNFYKGISADNIKIIEISQWGNLNLGNSAFHFYQASNLVLTAIDAPDLTGVTSLSNTFYGCEKLGSIGNMSLWDVSGIYSMNSLFRDATSFNQDVSTWNVSLVSDMYRLFASTDFNMDISNWDISSVTYMPGMFEHTNFFNQDISNWNTSSVTVMSFLFNGASAFNQNISTWDVGNVETMAYMFSHTKLFNQSLNTWNVSSVISMYAMFSSASAFNQPLDRWNTSSVKELSYLFAFTKSFNQPLDTWNTSSVIDIFGMFSYSEAFNQNVSSWDVSSVETMDQMFENSKAFDHDISSWNVSKVVSMRNMFSGSEMTTDNYDKLLSSWSTLPLQQNVVFDAGNSYYTNTSAKNYIINNYSWTITDGGVFGVLSPNGLNAKLTDNNIELRWNPIPSTKIVEYNIYRSNGGDYIKIATTGDTSYSDIGLDTGIYYYKISSVVEGIESILSDELVVENINFKIVEITDLTINVGDFLELSWEIENLASGTYNITLNGKILVSTQQWIGRIVFKSDKLAIGEYEFTINVYHESGLMQTDTVLVSVILGVDTIDTPTLELDLLELPIIIFAIFSFIITKKYLSKKSMFK